MTEIRAIEWGVVAAWLVALVWVAFTSYYGIAVFTALVYHVWADSRITALKEIERLNGEHNVSGD